MKLVIGITGASGMIYPLRLLEFLKEKKIETHLIISEPAETLIKHELGHDKREMFKYVSNHYNVNDLSSSIASGSQFFDAMAIIPCSMNTLAAIANGYSDNLIRRVADVAIKEKRKLIIVPREAPLSAIHLENLLKLSRLDVIIIPACPAFYHKPKNLDEAVNFIVGKVLSQLGIDHDLYKAWKGE